MLSSGFLTVAHVQHAGKLQACFPAILGVVVGRQHPPGSASAGVVPDE